VVNSMVRLVFFEFFLYLVKQVIFSSAKMFTNVGDESIRVNSEIKAILQNCNKLETMVRLCSIRWC